MYVWRGLARIVPSDVTIPTPILLAEPSKPIAIFLFISLWLQNNRNIKVGV